MILVMLYSGLRISDVAVLKRSSVRQGRLFLRTEKTGVQMAIPLKLSVIDSLEALPHESETYYFWTGNGKPSSIIGSMRRSVDAVLTLANIEGHPHRFRDTCAVELLKAGESLERVAELLGHRNIRITQEYYNPWVASRQRLLDDALAKLDFGESGPAKVRVKNGPRNSKGRVLSFPA